MTSKNIFPCRDGSRTAETSKMEHFVIIVNGRKPIIIISITKRSILDVAAVLDRLFPVSSNTLILWPNVPKPFLIRKKVSPSLITNFGYSLKIGTLLTKLFLKHFGALKYTSERCFLTFYFYLFVHLFICSVLYSINHFISIFCMSLFQLFFN